MSNSLEDPYVRAAVARNNPNNISPRCILDTVDSHDQTRGNYCWLSPYFGSLQWVDYREPSERESKATKKKMGFWKTYSRYWWARHAIVVNHDPKTLVKEHVEEYVNPKTKRIDLRFYFEAPSGLMYVTFPIRKFYELERDYFVRHKLCKSDVSAEAENTRIIQEHEANMKVEGLTPFIPAEKFFVYIAPSVDRRKVSTKRKKKGGSSIS
jgi:hypothetical protein